jgi:hypothetical protein
MGREYNRKHIWLVIVTFRIPMKRDEMGPVRRFDETMKWVSKE